MSLLFLGKDNFIRKPLIRLVRWKLFEWVILLVIVGNSITLAMNSSKPGFNQTTMGRALRVCNGVFLSVFGLEAACKIIALGFAFAEHTYLRSGKNLWRWRAQGGQSNLYHTYPHSGWNCLDLAVVLFGILEIFTLGNYTMVRCFRVLKPIRLISTVEPLRVGFQNKKEMEYHTSNV